MRAQFALRDHCWQPSLSNVAQSYFDSAAGLDIKEPEICVIVLAGLPPQYDMIVTVLQNKSEEELSLDVILPQLTQVEQSDRVPIDTRQNLAARVSRRREYANSNRRCFDCRKLGHTRQDCPQRHNRGSGTRPAVELWIYLFADTV